MKHSRVIINFLFPPYKGSSESISQECVPSTTHLFTLKPSRSLSFIHSKLVAHIPAIVSKFDYPRIIQPLFVDFYTEKAGKILNQRAKKYLVYFEAKPSLLKVQSLKN